MEIQNKEGINMVEILSRFRKLGGKKFQLWNKYNTKHKAMATARYLRSKGKNARILKLKEGKRFFHVVYYRKR